MIDQTARRVAAIDIGSNSVRLLVCDIKGGDAIPVYRAKRTTRLIAGLTDGLLDAESMERTLAAAMELYDEAVSNGATDVSAFGTSAMREGANVEWIVENAARLGLAVEVLSGVDEARMAYAGAAPGGRSGVIDIGGGSTELLVGEDGQATRAVSMRLGAVALFERMGRQSPSPSPRAMTELALRSFRNAADEDWVRFSDQWVGVGGTITTLAAMLMQMEVYDPERIEGFRITQAAAKSWLDMLWAMPMPLRTQLKGLEPARADIIPYGIAILLAFFELTGINEIRASDRDNLLGFIKSHWMG